MERVKNIPDLTGLRRPSINEIKVVSEYMRAYCTKSQSTVEKFGLILLICGLVLIIPGTIKIFQGEAMATFLVLLGVLAIIGFISTEYGVQNTEKEIEVFCRGKFRVVEGLVSKIKDHSTTPLGTVDIEFTSMYGQVLNRSFNVKKNKVEINTHLLLVYIDKEDNTIIKKFSQVFTPYMLSEDGIKNMK